MTTSFGILGIAILVVAAIFALGWIVPLVMGIVRQKKTKNGLALIIIGGVWGLIGLTIIAIPTFGYVQMRKYTHVEKFDPTTYKGTMGKIELSYTGESKLTLMSVDHPKRMALLERMELLVTNGIAMAPIGNYMMAMCEFTAKDQNNQIWTASCYLPSSGSNKISIQANTPYKLQVGPPFTASVSAEPGDDGKVTMNLMLAGAGNTSYGIRGPGTWAPGFQVLDKTGNVVWQGKFAYG